MCPIKSGIAKARVNQVGVVIRVVLDLISTVVLSGPK